MTAWAYCNAETTLTDEQPHFDCKSVTYPVYWQRFRDFTCVDQVSISSGSIIYVESNPHSRNCVIDHHLLEKFKKSEEICCDFVTMLRFVLYALPNYEAQEITTLFVENVDDDAHPKCFFQPWKRFFFEEFCDDFDDSSSDGYDSSSLQPIGVHAPPDQELFPNVHGFVKKARKTVTRSWSSFNKLRKNSVRNIVTNFPNRREVTSIRSNPTKNKKGSVQWKSFGIKLHPRYTISKSTMSTFYLNLGDLRLHEMNQLTNSKLEQENDHQRGVKHLINSSLVRPSSPPPPPPSLHRIKCAGTISPSSLPLSFANEPLYQFYTSSIVKPNDDESVGYEEVRSMANRPSAMELITPSLNGHGHSRSLWCEVAEVKNSGILDVLSIGQQKLQEAKFEVITSEASYYKSLLVLDEIFVCNPQLQEGTLISKNDWKTLFGNVSAVRKCSKTLLLALEKCWQESIMLVGLSDIIYEQASTNFKVFVKYCSNQVYIDRTLKMLRKQNPNFVKLINELEADFACQSLSLHSFLMLPMQRITRMPLLIEAILSKLDPSTDDHLHKTLVITLAMLNEIVKECNENARKFERYEEMLLLSRQLEFSRKDVKTFSVASSSRWLVRSGFMIHLSPQSAKSTFTRKLIKPSNKLYFFLFNDVLIIARRRRCNGEDSFIVMDHCHRNLMQMSKLEDISSFYPLSTNSSLKYLLLLTILENHEGRTIEMVLSCDSDSTRQRWLEATSFPTSNDSEEKLYDEWDCPQVLIKHLYMPREPDELMLQVGDVVKVLKKTTDGWYYGEKIQDGVIGWFPGNHAMEVASQHARAKNLRLRHHLLTLSANYIQNQQKL